MALIYSVIVSARADTRVRRATTGLVLPVVPCDVLLTFLISRTLRITFGAVARAATSAPAQITETPAVAVKRMAFRQSHTKPFIYTPHHDISISRTSYAANFLVHNKLLIKKYVMLYRVQIPRLWAKLSVSVCIEDLMNIVLFPTLYVHVAQCNDNKINF